MNTRNQSIIRFSLHCNNKIQGKEEISISIKEFAEKYIKAWQEALLDGKLSTFEALIDQNAVYHAPHSDLSWEAYKQHIVDTRKYTR